MKMGTTGAKSVLCGKNSVAQSRLRGMPGSQNGLEMGVGRVVGPKRGSKRPENNEFGECCEWGGLLGQYFGHNRFKNREFGRKTGGTGTETTKFTKNAKMVKKSGDLAGKQEIRCSRQGTRRAPRNVCAAPSLLANLALFARAQNGFKMAKISENWPEPALKWPFFAFWRRESQFAAHG